MNNVNRNVLKAHNNVSAQNICLGILGKLADFETLKMAVDYFDNSELNLPMVYQDVLS